MFGEGPSTLRDFNIRSQASYVGIGRDGAIVSTSRSSGKNWTNILDALRAS